MKKIRNFIKKCVPNWLIMRRLSKENSYRIMLTFDDGPCPVNTPKVLEVLERYNAKAVFFVVGKQIEEAPEILQLVKEKGHMLANHSYAHDVNLRWKPLDAYNDMKKCNSLIKAYSGQISKYYRPPCGKLGLFNVLSAVFLGQKIVLASLEGQDWKCQSQQEAEQIAEYMSANLKSRDVVLLHDDNNYSPKTLEALLSRAEELYLSSSEV